MRLSDGTPTVSHDDYTINTDRCAGLPRFRTYATLYPVLWVSEQESEKWLKTRFTKQILEYAVKGGGGKRRTLQTIGGAIILEIGQSSLSEGGFPLKI